MTPTDFRKGGKDTEMRFAVGACSLGAILVAATPKGIAAILLGDDPQALVRDLEDRFPKAELIGGDRDFERVVAQVVGLVEAPATGLDLPLDVRGTAFQHRVWQALRDIPGGDHRDLHRHRRPHRRAQGRSRRRRRLRGQQDRGRHSLPSRGPQRRRARRLSLGRRAQAPPDRAGGAIVNRVLAAQAIRSRRRARPSSTRPRSPTASTRAALPSSSD